MTDGPVARRTRERLTRIAAEDGALRSFIRVDADEAMAAAAASDARRCEGAPLSAVDGVATAIKDNLAMAGKPWTAGISGRAGRIADADSAAVARLRAAGAILIGGANMEEAALGAVTDNPTFGRCLNPLDHALTPGGSSGGSAAALATGFVDLALGTDTMGSVRVPAAYCGVCALKPTAGTVDRDGLALLSTTLDTIGPMARDARMLWPALQVLGNAAARSAWHVQSSDTGREDLSALTFGMPAQLSGVACEDGVLAGLDRAVSAIRRLGGQVRHIDLPGWQPQKARRAGLLVAEAEGAAALHDLIDRPGAISPHLRRMLVFGRDASDAKRAAASAEIASAAQAAEAALREVDALILPTAPQRAFGHGTPAPANQADLTALANFAGCPAVALPVRLAGEALPASVQILSPRGSDPALLRWAEILADGLTPGPGAI